MADSMNWRIRAPVDPNAEPRRTSYGGRRPNNGRQVGQAEKDRPDDLRARRTERQENAPEDQQAILEGRRLYLGNLLYSNTVEDINQFLVNNGFDSVQNVHISIDPLSGRNPGYCFLEFADKVTADTALAGLEGAELFGRPVKCRPCQSKGAQRQSGRYESSSGNNRWDNWRRTGSDNDQNLTPRKSGSGQLSKAQEEGRQLYVGGLPRMINQANDEVEIRSIFHEYDVETVSKRISPREESADSARRHFCFVDFSTGEQAKEAAAAVNGQLYKDAPLKVYEALPKTSRTWDRQRE